MLTNRESGLDLQRLRELFDLRGELYTLRGGSFEGDPYPGFHELRESGPVHEGTPGELVGYTGPAFFTGLPMPERPHFSAFDFATCTEVVKNTNNFSASQHEHGSAAYEHEAMLLFMDGARHRRLRALVQAAFTPKRSGWWIENWIADTAESLIDIVAANGKSDLNVEVFAAIPLLTICRSFGISVAESLEIRAAILAEGSGIAEFNRIVTPLIAARRDDPHDDLITVLVQAELEDEDGSRHQLSDSDVLIFSFLLLAAGTGTTWKQLGITTLALLQRPQWLERLQVQPALIGRVVEESMRWMPTDPAFARFAIHDTDLAGVRIPKGAVVHACFAAGNRDPKRWDRPDEFDPERRPAQSNLGFGRGAHICLGQYVARAEMCTAITALVRRLPRLRLDPDAEPPRMIGMYERGPTSVPVVWDPPDSPQHNGSQNT